LIANEMEHNEAGTVFQIYSAAAVYSRPLSLNRFMHKETLSTVKPNGFSWGAKALIILAAAFASLAANTVLAQPTFSVGTNLVDISQAKGNETDPSIAFNPLSPSNMVVVSATDGTVPGLFRAFTTNLGASWQTNFIATNNDSQGLIPAYGEPSVAWDSYGNLFLVYLPDTFEGIAVAVSTNGGDTFTLVTNLAALDATDQPRITAPFAGAAAGSVWVVYKDYTTASTPLQVQGELSTGLGTNGSFGLVQIVPDSGDGGFADIAVGPLGQVLVAFQDNLQGLPDPMAFPTANLWVSVKTNAISSGSVSSNGFGPGRIVASDAIGGVTYIDAAPTGIGVNAAPGLGWDYDIYGTNYDKVRLIYTAVGPNGNAVISFLSSDGSGRHWSGETFVDDDALSGSNDHFLPRMAVDPATGIIGCSWYDCRNDQGSGSQSITNEFEESFMLTGYMVTNVNFTNNLTPVSETWIDTTGQGTNIVIMIAADNVNGTLMKIDKSDNVYIYGLTNTNFIMNLAGTNTNVNAMVTVFLTNIFPMSYTTGSGANKAAIMYTTLSFDGGQTFLANQQLMPANEIINAPAVGIASEVAGSDGLNGWGHYTALTAYGANFFPVWADNSDVTTNNPDGANNNFDLYMLSSAGSQISVPTADLSIFVTNSPNPVISEGVLVYSVVVSNNGPTRAGPVTVTNILSPFVTLEAVIPALGGTYSVNDTANGQEEVILTLSSVAVQASLTNTIRVTASTSSIDTNIATVFSPLIDLFPVNNSNQLVLVIDGQDLAMSMTASETNVLFGDTVTSSITVTNLGPATNGPVFITNQFSPNWTNVTVQAQGTNLVTYTPSGPLVIVNLGLLPVGLPVTATFTAVASSVGFASELGVVASQDVDTNLANNSASNTFFIIGEDLAVSLSASTAGLQVGQTVTYTEQVSNLGISTNAEVLVTNTFSSNLGSISVLQPATNYTINGSVVVFNLGTLNVGQVVPITLTALATSPGAGADTAVVDGQNFDTNLANNTAQATVTIVAAPPMISNLVVTPLASSAFIVWETAAPATAQVEYGVTSGYGSFSGITPASTHHVVLLTGLTGGTSYDFEALSWVGSTLYTTNGSFGATNTLILNTQDAKYSGLWTKGTVGTGIYGAYYQFANTTVSDPTAWALYDPYIPAAGLYNVYIWYPQNTTFTTNAQVYVYGATNDFILSVNETAHGGAWQPVATNLYFASGTNGHVILYNDTGDTNKYLVANAMMWVYNAAQDDPTNGGVPAWWANFYFGTNVNGSVSGAADADGDGYSNYAEYVFGTDPTDATSHLNFTVALSASNVLSVTFSPDQGGRSYQLQAAADLVNPVWTTLTNAYTSGTNGAGAFTVTQPNSSSFYYRLSAQITP
jgi:uncharacterized repeat protein (TIGR01451 family)